MLVMNQTMILTLEHLFTAMIPLVLLPFLLDRKMFYFLSFSFRFSCFIYFCERSVGFGLMFVLVLLLGVLDPLVKVLYLQPMSLGSIITILLNLRFSFLSVYPLFFPLLILSLLPIFPLSSSLSSFMSFLLSTACFLHPRGHTSYPPSFPLLHHPSFSFPRPCPFPFCAFLLLFSFLLSQSRSYFYLLSFFSSSSSPFLLFPFYYLPFPSPSFPFALSPGRG